MEIGKKTIHRIIIGVLICIGVYWLLHEPQHFRSIYTFLKNIFLPFFIGAGIAFILNVPMRAIEKLFGFINKPTLRRAVSLILTFVAVIAVLTAVLWTLIPDVVETI